MVREIVAHLLLVVGEVGSNRSRRLSLIWQCLILRLSLRTSSLCRRIRPFIEKQFRIRVYMSKI